MVIPLPVIPAWAWRWLAIIGVLLAAWLHGYVHGRNIGEKELTAFKTSVEVAGKVQAATTARVVANQKEITDAAAKDYEGKLALLRNTKPSSVPNKRPDGSAVPTFSCPTPVADGRPADPVPVESVPKSDFDELRQRATETTLEYVGLRQWVRDQQKAFSDAVK